MIVSASLVSMFIIKKVGGSLVGVAAVSEEEEVVTEEEEVVDEDEKRNELLAGTEVIAEVEVFFM